MDGSCRDDRPPGTRAHWPWGQSSCPAIGREASFQPVRDSATATSSASREPRTPGAAGSATAPRRTSGWRVSRSRSHRFAVPAVGVQSGRSAAAWDRAPGRSSSSRAALRAARAARQPARRATRRGRLAPARARCVHGDRGLRWATRSPSRPRATRSARSREPARGFTTRAPLAADSSGIAHACARQSSAKGTMIGPARARIRAASDERQRMHRRGHGPKPPLAAQRALVDALAPPNVGQFGEPRRGDRRR